MGSSQVNIDRTYGHLARDSHYYAVQLLDNYNSNLRDVDASGRFVDASTPSMPFAATARSA